MPIYEYHCKACDNIFEVLTLSAKDAGQAACTKCKSDKVEKVMSAGSFRLTSSKQIPAASSAGCGHGGFS